MAGLSAVASNWVAQELSGSCEALYGANVDQGSLVAVALLAAAAAAAAAAVGSLVTLKLQLGEYYEPQYEAKSGYHRLADDQQSVAGSFVEGNSVTLELPQCVNSELLHELKTG